MNSDNNTHHSNTTKTVDYAFLYYNLVSPSGSEPQVWFWKIDARHRKCMFLYKNSDIRPILNINIYYVCIELHYMSGGSWQEGVHYKGEGELRSPMAPILHMCTYIYGHH